MRKGVPHRHAFSLELSISISIRERTDLVPNYLVEVVLDSGVVLVLLGVEVVLVPDAAGLLFSQPTVNANNPQRTSNVQIFFIALTFPKNCARNVLRRDRPAPSHYLKRPHGANIFPLRRKNIENYAVAAD
jgi:hypothetical protein